MPLAIRDYETGKYFAHGVWTADPALAENFVGEEAIKKAVTHYKVAHAEMVILDSKKRYVSSVRLDGAG